MVLRNNVELVDGSEQNRCRLLCQVCVPRMIPCFAILILREVANRVLRLTDWNPIFCLNLS